MQKRLAARLEDDGYGRLIGREPNLTAEAAEKLYPNLKPKVRDAMIKAHNDVWEFGMKNNREMVIAIDESTGKTLLTSKGETKQVTINISKFHEKKYITIHNHPSGNSFSVADMVTLNNAKGINAIGVQGHNGIAYSLRIGDGKRIQMSSERIQKMLIALREDLISEIYEQGMSRNELSHKVVKEIADYYGWDYKRYAP
ncbi:MAG: hypothetical protein RR292_03410 [Christensenellaceae bacterium]